MTTNLGIFLVLSLGTCNGLSDNHQKLCEFVKDAIAMDEFEVKCRDDFSVELLLMCPAQNPHTIDPDKKELLLRRIRRAVLASISPDENYQLPEGLKIEYNGNQLTVPDPLTIEITDGNGESTTHKIHFLATYPVIAAPKAIEDGEADHTADQPSLDTILKVFGKKIEILMEEYKSLRAEILQRLGALNAIMAFSIPAVGLALAASYNVYTAGLNQAGANQIGLRLLAGVILIAVPLVTSTMNKLWLNEASNIGRVGYFIARIEMETNRFFDRFRDENNQRLVHRYDLDIDYETTLRRIRRHYNLEDRFSLGPEPGRVTRLFIISEIVTTLIGIGILYSEKETAIQSLGNNVSIGLLILLFVTWLTIYVNSVMKRFRKVSYVEQWHEALISTDPILRIQSRKAQPYRRFIRSCLPLWLRKRMFGR